MSDLEIPVTTVTGRLGGCPHALTSQLDIHLIFDGANAHRNVFDEGDCFLVGEHVPEAI